MEKSHKVNPARFREPAIIDHDMSEFLDLLVPSKMTVATIVFGIAEIKGIGIRGGNEFSIGFDDDCILAFGYRHPVGSRAFDMAVKLGFYTEAEDSLRLVPADRPLDAGDVLKDLMAVVAAQQEQISELKQTVRTHTATNEEILKALQGLTTLCTNTQRRLDYLEPRPEQERPFRDNGYELGVMMP